VVHALQTAWWAIIRAAARDCTHLQQALELCVRAGHDTDTTAAIAGGLLSARWGASAVPQRWRRMLHGWPGMTARDLVALAVLTARGGVNDADGSKPTANKSCPVESRNGCGRWASSPTYIPGGDAHRARWSR